MIGVGRIAPMDGVVQYGQIDLEAPLLQEKRRYLTPSAWRVLVEEALYIRRTIPRGGAIGSASVREIAATAVSLG